MIIPRDFTLPFIRKQQITSDAFSFYFDRVKRGSAVAEEPELNFLPGQYVKMFLDVPNPDERGSSRSFSIASSPLEKEYLMITTHIIQSTFKKTMLSLTPGTQVRFFGPVGRFVFDENEPKSHIFLAGGIGITPFRSMLMYAKAKNIQTPITLFVSFSKIEEMVFYDELMILAKERFNIKVVYTITHPDSSGRSLFSHLPGGQVDSWKVGTGEQMNTYETGRISEELIKKYCPNFSDSLFYISGPSVMVDGMMEIVNNLNVPDEQVRKEKFVGY